MPRARLQFQRRATSPSLPRLPQDRLAHVVAPFAHIAVPLRLSSNMFAHSSKAVLVGVVSARRDAQLLRCTVTHTSPGGPVQRLGGHVPDEEALLPLLDSADTHPEVKQHRRLFFAHERARPRVCAPLAALLAGSLLLWTCASSMASHSHAQALIHAVHARLRRQSRRIARLPFFHFFSPLHAHCRPSITTQPIHTHFSQSSPITAHCNPLQTNRRQIAKPSLPSRLASRQPLRSASAPAFRLALARSSFA